MSTSPFVLLIDNYDSFVFNLSRYLQELGVETRVHRNDELSVDDVRTMNPSAIVLSPGPCTPTEAGICMDLVRELGPTIPILGVCLGHQAIGAALGAAVVRAPVPVHGECSLITHDGKGLFAGCESPFPVARYHSLVIDEATLPATLDIHARTHDGIVMALAHRQWPVYGVQFHPESILTRHGHRMLRNFLDIAGSLPLEMEDLPPGDHVSSQSKVDDFYQRELATEHLYPLPQVPATAATR
jgi:glutamine amidotransferase of anthranilate synthase or aminodeoxychorismate synthase